MRRDNVIRKPRKKSGAKDLHFFFPKLQKLLKSVDGARRTVVSKSIGEKGGIPQNSPTADVQLHETPHVYNEDLMKTMCPF